ncbi:unnamed protein product [Darwinula stevensoni]|uniref:Partial AB-hydrolase lipase domain-containing protein n=1 Tax=Darwinula stevensoni TaxID=69355 RepID=A0A7R9FN31_9CRUS|nr:unnamed protein product [Darwinula stevensoni]CAG0896315.1 unnamed protein product [Darwinula stevensoni]
MSKFSMLALALLSLASASYSRVLEDDIAAIIRERLGGDADPRESAQFVRETLEALQAAGGIRGRRGPPRVSQEIDDDLDLDTPELIAKYGYPSETHTITTADGYIIDMHRIPYGLSGPGEGPRIPILLQHGLLSSSACWVLNGPENGLGFLLADAGYDVWLGNVRGNTYARNHVSMTPDDGAFWSFSWDQMGEFDVPAMLDEILQTTGQDKLHYVGHSMGTIVFWVMSDMRPEYRDHILSMHGMGPVAKVHHMTSPIRLIAPFADQIQWLLEMLGLHEFMPSSAFMDFLAAFICTEDWSQFICESVIFLLCGFDEAQMDEALIPMIVAHNPAGTSTQNVVHFAQLVNSERFQHFNWGREGNLEHYGQEQPPEYDLTKVNTPVFLYYGDNDWLADPEDVVWLASELPSLIDNYRVPFDAWNHLDFLWGIDVKEFLFNRLLEMIKIFEP